MNRMSRWAGVALAVTLADSLAQAQTTERVSIATSGAQGNAPSEQHPSISADGRHVAFESSASNLVAVDTNGFRDIFVRDRQSGTTERVSVATGGAQGNGDCRYPSISADGRFVAFESYASNLVSGDTNGASDIFLHDRQTLTTQRVSLGSAGVQGTDDSSRSSISADGRFVAFWSRATNLVTGDTNGVEDVFVHDRLPGTTERVSVGSSGAQGNDYSSFSSISADGRFVAFFSRATNLVAVDTNARIDVFVHDRQIGTTELVSIDSGGVQGDGNCYDPSISSDGRYVAFEGEASNLVVGDTNGCSDVFVRDRLSGTTERVSVDSLGAEANLASFGPSVSDDGRIVAFCSSASNLVVPDNFGYYDVFVHDRQSATTGFASVDSGGAQGDSNSQAPSVSANGRFVAFFSWAANLILNDTNGCTDVFVRDRGPGNPGIDLCQAGTGSVTACPCSNPPANTPRGCDNSAGTGGAQLTSSGSASLAYDSVVFVTNGEKPTATSIVLQGDAEVTIGVAFGQGVRCVGGGLKRLYVKTGSAGSITAPGPGDPSVSARSAALGSPISAGSNRWYAVYYRDPIVFGGCPATSTYNVTQTQLMAWGS